MLSRKLQLAVICGGKSAEHEVSLQSAKNVIEAADKNKYEIIVIGIRKDGQWFLMDSNDFLVNKDNPKKIKLKLSSKKVALISSGKILILPENRSKKIDVAFPVLHGPFGEDGATQGLLKTAGIPFVGADVLGSAIGMDKDVMKRLLRDANLPISKFLVFHKIDKEKIGFDYLKKALGLPFFIKPCNLGSSVGIHKISGEAELFSALTDAFKHDSKIIIEEAINGREIECSVLGNERPIASIPGEIIIGKSHQFYSYDAKYIDQNGAQLVIPAKLDKKLAELIQKLAIKAFEVLCCKGMARIDFFLAGEKIFINEINTIPGFTNISMYPKLWEASGISYSELIDHLIKLARGNERWRLLAPSIKVVRAQ